MDRILPGRKTSDCSFQKCTFTLEKNGVPNGSILGPVLFLLFINDLPNSVKATAKMFADDTKLYSKISKAQLTVRTSKI